jgi:hypothetical protein
MEENIGVDRAEKEKSRSARIVDAQPPSLLQSFEVALHCGDSVSRRAVGSDMKRKRPREIGVLRVHDQNERLLHLAAQEGDESFGQRSKHDARIEIGRELVELQDGLR